ncbi:MAG TPA: hypothetical protein VNP72_06135 [Longimicrobium sp.]|nr:hypothetical protein [Longimicrobium sp.]
MSRKDERAHDTFGTVRDRYREWSTANPRPRSPSAIGMPELPDSAVRLLGTAVGMGTGALLLALAVVAAYAAGTWADTGRQSATVAYTVVAFFLTLAGLGAIIGTWNHFQRVLRRGPEQH